MSVRHSPIRGGEGPIQTDGNGGGSSADQVNQPRGGRSSGQARVTTQGTGVGMDNEALMLFLRDLRKDISDIRQEMREQQRINSVDIRRGEEDTQRVEEREELDQNITIDRTGYTTGDLIDLEPEAGEMRRSSTGIPHTDTQLVVREEKYLKSSTSGDSRNIRNTWQGGMRLPRGGWLTSPFGNLQFAGRNDKVNPMRFLRQFERIAEHEGVKEVDKLYFFAKCMVRQAADWWELGDFETYQGAIRAFKRFYWGEEAQSRFREFMYTGKYRHEPGRRMSEYAIAISREAKLLEPPMSDHDIITSLKRHFPTEIARELRPGVVRNLHDLASLLDEIEEETKRAVVRKTRPVVTIEEPYTGAGREPASRQVRISEVPQTTYRKTFNREGYDQARRQDGAPRAQAYVRQNNMPNGVANRPMTRGGYGTGAQNERYGRENVAAMGTRKGEGTQEANNDEAARKNKEQSKLSIVRMKNMIDDLEESADESEVKEVEPNIEIQIGNTEMKALVDTGAQVSAVDKEAVEKIIKANGELKAIPIKKTILRGAFGEKANVVSRKVQITFRWHGHEITHEFFEANRLIAPMLLGMDFLTKNQVQLTCSRKAFELKIPTLRASALAVLRAEEANDRLGMLKEKNADLFKEGIGLIKVYTHTIKMMDERPYKAKTYPIPMRHKERVRVHLMELEAQGVIEKAPTPYINPLVVVVKKNGDLRVCLDARELNKRMEGDHAQPPTIDEIFAAIGHKRIYSTLDITKAFLHIPLHDRSKQYTGFMFDNQSYVYRRLPFGLKTSGAAFSRAIDMIIGNDLRKNVITYLDDILIASNNYDEHIMHLEKIFKKLAEAGINLNYEKCEFLKTEIEFLGHTYKQVTAEMTETTKQAIQNFARPKNRRAVQAFLGLANWDRRFIPNLAALVKPIEKLLKKDERFRWESEQEEAFEKTKQAFAQAEVLWLARPELKYGVYVDASQTGLGARLFQYNKQGEEYTIAYASRGTKGPEKNYTITELEGLGLVWALKKWRVILLGRRVRVYTDHKSLQFLSACVQTSQRIARWISFLQEFDLDIRHIQGKENKTADALSRNIKMRAEKRRKAVEPRVGAVKKIDDGLDTTQWLKIIRDAQQESGSLKKVMQENKTKTKIRDGIIREHRANIERVIIPDEIAWEFVERIHRYLAHFGTDKVLRFANDNFVINRVNKIVRDVVASCETCQAAKHYTRPTRGEPYYVIPDKPGEIVSVDLFGPLPKSGRGYKYIMVVMDQFSKLVRLYPLKEQTAENVTEAMEENYFAEIGVPKEIVTDRGTQFTSERCLELRHAYGVNIRHTTPYNPQSNPVERVMRELGRILRVYASHNHRKWDLVVPRAESALNSTVHSSTNERLIPIDLHKGLVDHLQLCEELKPHGEPERMEGEVITEVRRHIAQQAQARAKQARKKGFAKAFEKGDEVWVKTHKLSNKLQRRTKKLYMLYEGPYVILREVRTNAYIIAKQNGEIKGTYNVRQMKPHRRAKIRHTEKRICGIQISRRTNIELERRMWKAGSIARARSMRNKSGAAEKDAVTRTEGMKVITRCGIKIQTLKVSKYVTGGIKKNKIRVIKNTTVLRLDANKTVVRAKAIGSRGEQLETLDSMYRLRRSRSKIYRHGKEGYKRAGRNKSPMIFEQNMKSEITKKGNRDTKYANEPIGVQKLRCRDKGTRDILENESALATVAIKQTKQVYVKMSDAGMSRAAEEARREKEWEEKIEVLETERNYWRECVRLKKMEELRRKEKELHKEIRGLKRQMSQEEDGDTNSEGEDSFGSAETVDLCPQDEWRRSESRDNSEESPLKLRLTRVRREKSPIDNVRMREVRIHLTRLSQEQINIGSKGKRDQWTTRLRDRPERVLADSSGSEEPVIKRKHWTKKRQFRRSYLQTVLKRQKMERVRRAREAELQAPQGQTTTNEDNKEEGKRAETAEANSSDGNEQLEAAWERLMQAWRQEGQIRGSEAEEAIPAAGPSAEDTMHA